MAALTATGVSLKLHVAQLGFSDGKMIKTTDVMHCYTICITTKHYIVFNK